MTDTVSADRDERTGWAEMFRGTRGIYTVLLNIGIGVHAIDIFVITTIMPAVVADIGGVKYYTWTTMLYMVGTIVGAASGHYARSVLGRRKGYVTSGMIFLAGAAACAASPTMSMLLTARVVEGVGGGLLISQSMALVGDLYTGRLRTRALAAITTTWSVAAVAGPMIGGIWASLGWWRGAFLTTCILTLAFIIAAQRVVPVGQTEGQRRLPVRRLALLAMSVLLVGCAGQFETLALKVLLIASGVVCLWQTLRMDGRGGNALFPARTLSLFAPIGAAYWVFFLLSASYTPLTIFMPLALGEVYALNPLWIGYVSTVFSLFWTMGSLVTAGWNDFWARVACVSGLAITSAATLFLALVLGAAPLWAVTILIAFIGIGIGMTNVHSTSWALAAAGKDQAGLVASAAPAMRSIGIAYGAAFAGLTANVTGLASHVDAEVVLSALPWVFAIGAGTALAGSLCVLRMYSLQPGVKI